MKRITSIAAVLVMMAAGAGIAEAQNPPAPLFLGPTQFQIQPALPETMPTWSHDELSGTAQHNIAATPGCGAANPQGGIPSMTSGNCP